MPPKKGSSKTRNSSSKRRVTKSKANVTKKAKTDTAPTPPPPIIGPLPTLILDTGGWNIKHGTVYPGSMLQRNNDVKPTKSQNVSAKPSYQLATLLSSQIDTIQNKSQLVTTRPLERGYIVDLGTQFQIWDYILQLENLEARHSFSNGGVSGVMPSVSLQPKPKTKINASVATEVEETQKIFTHTAAVFCLTQPFTPRCILEREDEVWFRDFGFGKVARKLGPCCSAFKYLKEIKAPRESKEVTTITSTARMRLEDDETGCCCVVDSGFSMTTVVPTMNAVALIKGIRRINIGGKLLTNLLKQTISYRKFNMMDEFFIVNEAKEALCFLSLNFDLEMKKAREVREGRRWFDREFVLPDFVDTFEGTVRLPAILKHLNNTEGKEYFKDCDATGEKDSNNVENDENQPVAANEENSQDASDDETEDQARKRIFKQREEERRLQELEEQERQALPLSTERFAIPEILFNPSDVGIGQLGLAETIVQSIEACDPIYREALYHNILLTGGNVKISFFRERLEAELRSLVPSKYKIRVYSPKHPDEYAWEGAKAFVRAKNMASSLYLERAAWESRKESGNEIWNESLLGCNNT